RERGADHMTLALDGRDAAALETALRRIAAARPAPGGATWEELVLDNLSSEPSLALLRALVAAQAGALRHLDGLPARARAAYLEQRLGIQRLEAVPDRLVAVIEADSKRVPVTLAARTRLKAGRGTRGERLYETVEAVRVLGAEILGAHSQRFG